MRTFIFIKNERVNNRINRFIIGMQTGNNFPSCQNDIDSTYYGCQCVEVTEKCCIDIGYYE